MDPNRESSTLGATQKLLDSKIGAGGQKEKRLELLVTLLVAIVAAIPAISSSHDITVCDGVEGEVSTANLFAVIASGAAAVIIFLIGIIVIYYYRIDTTCDWENAQEECTRFTAQYNSLSDDFHALSAECVALEKENQDLKSNAVSALANTHYSFMDFNGEWTGEVMDVRSGTPKPIGVVQASLELSNVPREHKFSGKYNSYVGTDKDSLQLEGTRHSTSVAILEKTKKSVKIRYEWV